MEDKTARWIIRADDGQYFLYHNLDDVPSDSEDILEVRLPDNMAMMLDYTQHSYMNMQVYFHAQWELMQDKLALDEPVYESKKVSGDDDVAFEEAFETIVKNNNLGNLGEEEE